MSHYTNILVNQMDLRCSQFIDILGDLEPTWVGYVSTVLNAVFSGSAILGNLLILVALKKDSRLHPPSKLLFRSLVSTDLCVGLIAQPSFVIYLIFILKNKLIFCEIIEGVTNVFGAVFAVISLCTLTGISVDRLLALQLGMRYKHFVTVVRVRRILVFSWLLVIFSALLQFWNFNVFMGVMTVVVVLCLVTTSFCYSKIFVTMLVLSTTFNLYNRKTYARSRGNQCNINGTPDYGGFPQFLSEPTCLYLEDQGSEKSCSFDVAKLFSILPLAIREGVKVRVRKCIAGNLVLTTGLKT